MDASFGLLKKWLGPLAVGIAIVGGSALLAACGGNAEVAPPAGGAASSPTAAASPAPTGTTVAKQTKPLTVEPGKGFVLAQFTATAEGLPPNKEVQFFWGTFDASFVTKVSAETVEYHQSKIEAKRVPLGRASVDASGKVVARLAVPEDYGEIHDIYAAIDGEDVAKGGFLVLRKATITPTEGPVGTPITIKFEGSGKAGWDRTSGVLYDHRFAGWISAITTRGTAVFQIRAAGPVGPKTIEILSNAEPYLNNLQSPNPHRVPLRFTFNVTADLGPPPDRVERPDPSRVAQLKDAELRTTMSADVSLRDSGVKAQLEPAFGAILSRSTLRAQGLKPGVEAELFWVTARGNRNPATGSQWALDYIPLGKGTANRDGSLSVAFEVPDDLGGFHAVKVVQGDKSVVEVPFRLEASLVDVAPRRVKVGETFTVRLKGVGWTELDNGFAVTYDNGYTGYACGFNSQGDITLDLVATGEPGTHLIDVYPMIYTGKDQVVYTYRLPQLNALEDFPALGLGYRLPIFRLAIEIIE